MKYESKRKSCFYTNEKVTNVTLSFDTCYCFIKTHTPTLSWCSRDLDYICTYNETSEAFETWSLQRIIKLSWIQHISNEKVLKMMKTERKLTREIKGDKERYLGHIYRQVKYELVSLECPSFSYPDFSFFFFKYLKSLFCILLRM